MKNMRAERGVHLVQDTETSQERPSAETFPIVSRKEVKSRDSTPDELAENKIVHYELAVAARDKLHRFKLLKVIEGLHYLFRFGQKYGDSYGFSFKTDEYEYAATNLTPAGQEELGRTIAAFIRSIENSKLVAIDTISISPADAKYTVKDIDACIEAILTHPDNKLTQEEIRAEYKGFEVLDLYQKLFGKVFSLSYGDKVRSRARARSRFFKAMAKKYLPDWQIIDDEFGGVDFYLRRINK